MKRKLINFIFFLIATNLIAQNSNIEVEQIKVTIGNNLLAQKDISATGYKFPKNIYHAYIEEGSGLITIQLCKTNRDGSVVKKKGNLLVYDPGAQQVLWSKKMLHHISEVEQFGRILLLTMNKQTKCLDLTTGENEWELTNHIGFADTINKHRDGIIHILNKDFEVVNRTHFDHLYQCHEHVGQYNLLVRENNSVLLDTENYPIAELNIGRDVLVKGTTLYYVNDNCLFEIDLSELINENKQTP